MAVRAAGSDFQEVVSGYVACKDALPVPGRGCVCYSRVKHLGTMKCGR